MSFFWECVIGTLAAVGLICILKYLYDIIVTDYMADRVRVELLLYGDSSDPQFGWFLRSILRPHTAPVQITEIYFMDLGSGKSVCKELDDLIACGAVINIR